MGGMTREDVERQVRAQLGEEWEVLVWPPRPYAWVGPEGYILYRQWTAELRKPFEEAPGYHWFLCAGRTEEEVLKGLQGHAQTLYAMREAKGQTTNKEGERNGHTGVR